jgi:hypothetical protein
MNSDIILEISAWLHSLDDLVAFAKTSLLHASVINEYKSGIAKQILSNIGLECSVAQAVRELKNTYTSKKRMDLKGYDTSHVPPEQWNRTWQDLHMIQHNYYWAIAEGRPDLAHVLFPVAKKKPRRLLYLAHVLGAVPEMTTASFEFFFHHHKEYRYHILDTQITEIIQQGWTSYIFDFFIKHDMLVVNQVLYQLFSQPDTPEMFLTPVLDYVTSRGGKVDVDVLISGVQMGIRNGYWEFVVHVSRFLTDVPQEVRDYLDEEDEAFRDF